MSGDATRGDPDDEELVRRFRAGDQNAARALFMRHEPRLRARARRRIEGRVRRKVGESDVVQEAYLAAFEGLDAFEDRGPGSFRRWLDGILEHKAIDELKRHVGRGKRSALREVSQSGSAVREEPAGAVPTPSVLAAGREEGEALARAIEGLDGDDRRVVELVHRQGKSFEEAGRVLGRSGEATRKLFRRALVRLGKRMPQAS